MAGNTQILEGMARWQELELGTDQGLLGKASDYISEAIELLNQHNPEAAIKKATEAGSLCDRIESFRAKGPPTFAGLKKLEEETLGKGGVLTTLSQIVIADSYYQIGMSGYNEETRRLSPKRRKELEETVSHYQTASGAFNLNQESFMKRGRAEIRRYFLRKIYGGLANTYLTLGANAHALGAQLIEQAEVNGPDNLNKTLIARGLICWGEAIQNFALVMNTQTAAKQNKVSIGSIGYKSVMKAVEKDVYQICTEGVGLAKAIGRPELIDKYLKPKVK